LEQPNDFWKNEDELDFSKVDNKGESKEESQPFEEWCESEELYRVQPLSDKEFVELYNKSNWGSENVRLRNIPVPFWRPTPRANLPESEFLPMLVRIFSMF
jgi:hypothetical protein